MNEKQLARMENGRGFIAALDQSGGSTPKALAGYGIQAEAYASEAEMFDLIHEMRTRVITSKAFTGEHILAAILFEMTMERQVAGRDTAAYLWEEKGIVPFLKIDKGLAETTDGVRLMKPIPELDATLAKARQYQIFGTKMRSVILEANEAGIAAIVEQQFDLGKRIAAAGLVPILEPEVDIHSPEKEKCEDLLLSEIERNLGTVDTNTKLMFKLTIPTKDNLYEGLSKDARVVRVVALSGGYTRQEADERLKKNRNIIASFSRALLNDLKAGQTQEEFDRALKEAVAEIYEASVY